MEKSGLFAVSFCDLVFRIVITDIFLYFALFLSCFRAEMLIVFCTAVTLRSRCLQVGHSSRLKDGDLIWLLRGPLKVMRRVRAYAWVRMKVRIFLLLRMHSFVRVAQTAGRIPPIRGHILVLTDAHATDG